MVARAATSHIHGPLCIALPLTQLLPAAPPCLSPMPRQALSFAFVGGAARLHTAAWRHFRQTTPLKSARVVDVLEVVKGALRRGACPQLPPGAPDSAVVSRRAGAPPLLPNPSAAPRTCSCRSCHTRYIISCQSIPLCAGQQAPSPTQRERMLGGFAALVERAAGLEPGARMAPDHLLRLLEGVRDTPLPGEAAPARVLSRGQSLGREGQDPALLFALHQPNPTPPHPHPYPTAPMRIADTRRVVRDVCHPADRPQGGSQVGTTAADIGAEASGACLPAGFRQPLPEQHIFTQNSPAASLWLQPCAAATGSTAAASSSCLPTALPQGRAGSARETGVAGRCACVVGRRPLPVCLRPHAPECLLATLRCAAASPAAANQWPRWLPLLALSCAACQSLHRTSGNLRWPGKARLSRERSRSSPC